MLHRPDFQDLLSADLRVTMKLLKPVADLIALLVACIINLSLKTCVCPSKWKIAKIIPLPTKESFSGKNSRPISLLPALSKIMEQIICEQIQAYLGKNQLNTVPACIQKGSEKLCGII